MPDDDDIENAAASLVRRRTFIGTTVAVGGAIGALPVLSGCLSEADDQTRSSTISSESPTVRMQINGESRQLTVDTRTSLLDMLRERLGLVGTKKGCDQGACGACTIELDGRRVVSCLTLAVMHDGADITTIEGLERNGRLHPLQQAFIERDALQCGYCTPGQIMSGLGCIREGHNGSVAEVREWMSGNICRCGAYTNIAAAVAATSESRE